MGSEVERIPGTHGETDERTALDAFRAVPRRQILLHCLVCLLNEVYISGSIAGQIIPRCIADEFPVEVVAEAGDMITLLIRQLCHGQGAGPRPTSSAVVGDILEVARGIASSRRPVRQGTLRNGLPIVPMEELVTQYYARVTVADRAGVLAQIATVLGELDISIASVIQKKADPANQTAELMIMTHTSREADVREAVRRLEELDAVKEIVSLIRVEHWS